MVVYNILMAEIRKINKIITEAETLLQELDQQALQNNIAGLQAQTMQPNFWDQANAQDTMQEISLLSGQLEKVKQLDQLTQDLKASQSLINEAQNEKSANQFEKEEQQLADELAKLISQLKISQFLNSRFDKKSAIVSIHPGQGGTEAMDWAEMLSRMYIRYFERKNWKFKLISEIKGEEAGIKEISFEVKAPYAYGYLKNEQGTHRLVRLSPFNADNLRQTSFALVEVTPIIDQDVEVKLKEEDLSWHFTKSGGPGGQSVNKTSSAVELTHKPTKITVKSRQARSQAENKKTALKILKSKLAAIQEKNIEQNLEQEKGQHQHASWGTQIRNYVLHPYQLVKDTRTKVETNDAQSVLDGDLDKFIESAIKLKT
jgi:peptide chain release factor 2